MITLDVFRLEKNLDRHFIIKNTGLYNAGWSREAFKYLFARCNCFMFKHAPLAYNSPRKPEISKMVYSLMWPSLRVIPLTRGKLIGKIIIETFLLLLSFVKFVR